MSRVLEAIAARALARPDAVAISDTAGAFTYGQLPGVIESAVAALSRLAPMIWPGSPVAVVLDNSPAWAVLDLALVKLGWPVVPIPPFFTPEQRTHALCDAGAGLLITGQGGELDLEIAGTRLGATPLICGPAALPPGTAKITYTSGSTGHPKGVCLSQSQMEDVAASLVEVIGADFAGRHLPLLPLGILLENVAGLYPTLLAGGEYHVLSPAELGLDNPFRPDLIKLAGVIAETRASSLILVPELLRGLLMIMAFAGRRFPDLKLVAVGGAKVAPRLLEQAQALGLPVFEGYGLSECASVVALNTPARSRLGKVGVPLPHLTVRIDADGEIVVGPRPFLGYAGGALHLGEVRTGDLGALDADGFLSINGRRGAVIINAYGRNIAPEWVESELMTQPEIRQALVFGEAQPQLGALIVPLTPDMDESVIAAAVLRANQALPEYAQVRRWRLRGPFDPQDGELTGNGRPRRAVLLERHRDFIDLDIVS